MSTKPCWRRSTYQPLSMRATQTDDANRAAVCVRDALLVQRRLVGLVLLFLTSVATACNGGGDSGATEATTPTEQVTGTTVRRFRDVTTTTDEGAVGLSTTLPPAEPCPLTPELVAEQFPGRDYKLDAGSAKHGRSINCLVVTDDRSFSVNALTVESSPSAFVRVCENLRAEPVADIGDDACWSNDGLLAVLVDDRLQLNVSALDADEVGETEIRRKVIALATAVLEDLTG